MLLQRPPISNLRFEISEESRGRLAGTFAALSASGPPFETQGKPFETQGKPALRTASFGVEPRRGTAVRRGHGRFEI